MFCSILSTTLTSALTASDSKAGFNNQNKKSPITVRSHLLDGVLETVSETDKDEEVLKWIEKQKREKFIIYSYIPWTFNQNRLSNILDFFFTSVKCLEMTTEEARWFSHPFVYQRSVFIFTPSWYHFYFYIEFMEDGYVCEDFCKKIISCEDHKVFVTELEEKIPPWQKDTFILSSLEDLATCHCLLRSQYCNCGEYFLMGPYSEALLQIVLFHILTKRYRSKITGSLDWKEEKKGFNRKNYLWDGVEEKKIYSSVHVIVDDENEKLASFMFMLPTEIYIYILKYFVTTPVFSNVVQKINSCWEFTLDREIGHILHKCLSHTITPDPPNTMNCPVNNPQVTNTCKTINLVYNSKWDMEEGNCISSSQVFEHNVDGFKDSFVGIDSKNGEVLFIYWSPKDTGITTEQCSQYSIHFLQKMPKNMQSTSRGNAAPDIDINLPQFKSNKLRKFTGHTKKFAYYSDSKKRRWSIGMPMKSYRGGIIYDRVKRELKYGNYTKKNTEHWKEGLVYLKIIWDVFCKMMPRKEIEKMNKYCPLRTRIHPSIPFSTVAINDTEQMNLHKDTGNVVDSWSFVTLFHKGIINGGHYVTPEWGLAIKLAPGGILITKSNKYLHGNTPIIKNGDENKRISLVGYINSDVVENSMKIFVDNTIRNKKKER